MKGARLVLNLVPVVIPMFAAALTVTACDDSSQAEAPESAHFDANGGQHVFSNQLVLVVPPGALVEAADISIRDLEPAELETLLAIRGISPADLLFAFDASPDGLEFLTPVQVTVPLPSLAPEVIPLISELHLAERSASVADVSYVLDPSAQTLVLSLSHFTGYAGEIADEVERNECEVDATSCRCGKIEVEQDDRNFSCSTDDCQVLYSENTVRFIDCGGTEESSVFEKVTPGCVPELNLHVGERVLDFLEQTELTAEVTIGCIAPSAGREVTFFRTGPARLTVDSAPTDADGLARNALIALTEEGTVNIAAETSFTYVTRRITVNGVDLVREEANAELLETMDVYVVRKPVLELSALDSVIGTDDLTFLTAVLMRKEEPVPGQTVRFTVNGPAEASPTSAVTDDSGYAGSMLLSNTTEGTAMVIAASDVSVPLPNGEDVVIPVSDDTSVIIGDPPDYEGSVWQFEYSATTVSRYEVLAGCHESYIEGCTCEGDPNGEMREANIYREISGEFTLVEGELSFVLRPSGSNLTGLLQVDKPPEESALTCPIDLGMGSPGCSCDGYQRTDSEGYEGLSESRTQSLPNPTEEEFDGYVDRDEGSLDLDVDLRGVEPIVEQHWDSLSSPCPCLDWDGTRNYRDAGHFEFAEFHWNVPLRDNQWSELEDDGVRRSSISNSLTCVANCP